MVLGTIFFKDAHSTEIRTANPGRPFGRPGLKLGEAYRLGVRAW